jgi:hypothetical protein
LIIRGIVLPPTIFVNRQDCQSKKVFLLSIDYHSKILIKQSSEQKMKIINVILRQLFCLPSPLTIFVNRLIDQSLKESPLSIDYQKKTWTKNENDQCDSLSIILFDFFAYNFCKFTNWAISEGIFPVNWFWCKYLNKKWKLSFNHSIWLLKLQCL